MTTPLPERPPDRLITATELATSMRVSRMTVYRLIHDGELPAIRVGRCYRIRTHDVARYIQSTRPGS